MTPERIASTVDLPISARGGVRSILGIDRKSTRLNSSHTVIYTLSLHDALPIYPVDLGREAVDDARADRLDRRLADQRARRRQVDLGDRSEEHTSELQSHSDLHSFPTRRSSDLSRRPGPRSRR